MRLLHFFQRIGLVDLEFDLALLDCLEEILGAGFQLFAGREIVDHGRPGYEQ